MISEIINLTKDILMAILVCNVYRTI